MKLNFSGNWIAKIICLVVAIILWLFVMNDQNPLVEGEYDLQVEVQNLDSSLVALNVPDAVHVKLRMQRNTMLRLRESDMKAVIDLSETGPGEYTNTPIRLIVPAGAEVLEQMPKTVDLHVDHMVFRSVKPTIRTTGNPESGYGALVERITPDVVTLSGPSSEIEKVYAVVGEISVENRHDNFTAIVPLQLRDRSGEPVMSVHVAPLTVKVNMKMTRERMERLLPLRVQPKGTPAAGYQVQETTITPNQVRIVGAPKEVGRLTEWKLPEVSVDGADRDVVTQVPVPIPQDGTVNPEVVEVHIRVTPVGGQ